MTSETFDQNANLPYVYIPNVLPIHLPTYLPPSENTPNGVILETCAISDKLTKLIQLNTTRATSNFLTLFVDLCKDLQTYSLADGSLQSAHEFQFLSRLLCKSNICWLNTYVCTGLEYQMTPLHQKATHSLPQMTALQTGQEKDLNVEKGIVWFDLKEGGTWQTRG